MTATLTENGWKANYRGEDLLSSFAISDIDETANPVYYGYLDHVGNWYILENDTVNNTFRYSAGHGDYATAWAGRAALDYGMFDDIFRGA